MARPEYNDDDARQNLLDDYVALVHEWAARIDQLQTLADAQAAIIAAKNDEIESLRAELSACIAGGNDSAGAILADDEAGMMLAAGQGA